MIAITVSTNYDDLLKIILPQNSKFFDKWYIITSESDTKTIDTIKEFNCNKIEIIYFDFFANNKRFNKGGAIRYCQSKIIPSNYNGRVLILDSDIFLPDNFNEILLQNEIKEKTIYGTTNRFDYYSFDNFKNKKIDYKYPASQCFHGYFQLYKFNSKYLYQESDNCSTCDLEFLNYFSNRKIITGLTVSHLGKSGKNWDGRNDKNDFIIN